MRIYLPCLFTLVVSLASAAQDSSFAPEEEKWDVSLTGNLSLGLNLYSESWTGGEASSATWLAQLTLDAARQVSEKLNNRNTLKLAFGQTHSQFEDDNGTNRWERPRKSTDLIDFESLLRFTLKAFVDPYIGARALTGFLDIRDQRNPRYVNPVEITESAGAAKELLGKAELTWNARLGAAARQSIDRDRADRDTMGVARSYETDVTTGGGIELVTELKAANKAKWLGVTSLLKIYEALVINQEADTSSDWRYPDINWENTLSISVNKYLMLNVYAQMLYDKNIHVNARFKNTLGLGFTYAMGGKREGSS